MANWNDLKASVSSLIKTNGNKEITGQVLQNVLSNIIDNVGRNHTFVGVAIPATTPGTPDGNVYYISSSPGLYSNFNGSYIQSGEISALVWSGSKWEKKTIYKDHTNNYLDLSDCIVGAYYSAGGVRTQHTSYCCKDIDLTSISGKYVKFNLAYPNGKAQYCFIKTTDGTYKKLENEVISTNNSYLMFFVKDEYETLEASWDTSANPGAFICVLDSYIEQDILDTAVDSSKDYLLNQCIIDARISEKFTNDVTYKYKVNEEKLGYNTGKSGFVSDSNWRTTKINLSQADLIKISLSVVPMTVIAIKVFNSSNKEIYRNSFDSYYKSQGSQRNIQFAYFAKEKCTLELSYFKETLKIYSLSGLIAKRSEILGNITTDFEVDLSEPDNFDKYYSAGGTLSEYSGYESKEINVTQNMKNKTLACRLGFENGLGEYCFVKLAGDTYIPLRQYIIKEKEGYFEFSLPASAEKLQLSWDVNDLKGYHFIKSCFTYSDYQKLKEITEKYEGKETSLILGAKWDGGKYWSDGGVQSSHGNYAATSINIEQYAGKKIFVSMGYGTVSKPVGYMQYCYVKRSNGNYYYLNSFPWELAVTGYIVTLPKDAVQLDVSYDKISKYPTTPRVDLYEEGVITTLSKKVEQLESSVGTQLIGKTIFLFGDSISSTDYTWYKDYLKKYTLAEAVYNQGASGRNAAYQASNEYFSRLNTNPCDIIIALIGGNDSGESGSIGTFSEDSELHRLGESIVTETNISNDYAGTKFIQAISHIIRKWKNEYYNYRLKANLSAKIVSSNDTSTPLYEGTELQCLEYAKQQGLELGYGKSYYMMTTETAESKREKLIVVKMPKLYFCTTLPQKRYNDSNSYSKPENWERKRLAIIECCKKYEIPCIDLAKEFAIDWSLEPYWPGQGYSGTSKTDNQGIYTMDGLHPNEFGYEWISRIVAKYIK